MNTNDSTEVDIGKLFKEVTPIEEALQRGVREALRRHKLLGESIVVWRDGKVVWVPPEEIEVPGEPGTQAAPD